MFYRQQKFWSTLRFQNQNLVIYIEIPYITFSIYHIQCTIRDEKPLNFKLNINTSCNTILHE